MDHGQVDKVWAQSQAKWPREGPLLTGKDVEMDRWIGKGLVRVRDSPITPPFPSAGPSRASRRLAGHGHFSFAIVSIVTGPLTSS
jgi:hypothetical protein